MKIKLKSKLIERIGIGKIIGFIFGGIGFFLFPLIFKESDLYIRTGILLWYVSLGAIIGISGVLTSLPFGNTHIHFIIRGALFGAWMNFVLALFMHEKLTFMMVGTILEGMSPFCLIIEGLIFGVITDTITTTISGEGKKLIQ